jgi:hypothetical protein
MRQWLRALFGCGLLLALGGSTCTSTYTQANLDAEEGKQDASPAAEVKRDEQIGEQGGANEKAIDEQIEGIDGGSGADF